MTLCCKIKTPLSILCREAVLRTYAPAVSRVTVNMVYVPVDSNQEVVHAPCGALGVGATYFPSKRKQALATPDLAAQFHGAWI